LHFRKTQLQRRGPGRLLAFRRNLERDRLAVRQGLQQHLQPHAVTLRRQQPAIQPRRPDHATVSLGLDATENLDVICSAVVDVNPLHVDRRGADTIHQFAPDDRLAICRASPRILWHAAFRFRFAIKQKLPREAVDATIRRVQHQRRMQKEPATGPLSRRPQTRRATGATEIDFRGVVDDQLHVAGAARRSRLLAMRPDDFVERHVVLIEQAIGGLAIAPRLGLIGGAAVGPCCRLLSQPDQPFRSSLIAEFAFPKCHSRPLLRFQNDYRGNPPCARHATAGSPEPTLAPIPASNFPEASQRTSPLATSRFLPTQANPSPMLIRANSSGNTQLSSRRNPVESTNLWVIQRLPIRPTRNGHLVSARLQIKPF
jgi:hypothetical protein